jgi:hypothetical protein
MTAEEGTEATYEHWRVKSIAPAPAAVRNALVGRMNQEDTLCDLVIQNGELPVPLRVWRHDYKEGGSLWYGVRTPENGYPSFPVFAAAYECLDHAPSTTLK